VIEKTERLTANSTMFSCRLSLVPNVAHA